MRGVAPSRGPRTKAGAGMHPGAVQSRTPDPQGPPPPTPGLHSVTCRPSVQSSQPSFSPEEKRGPLWTEGDGMRGPSLSPGGTKSHPVKTCCLRARSPSAVWRNSLNPNPSSLPPSHRQNLLGWAGSLAGDIRAHFRVRVLRLASGGHQGSKR